MSCYYDKRGKPIDYITCMKLLGDPDYKFVARDILPDGKVVSTVWLGLDHSLGIGEKRIFETMIFPSEDDYTSLDCERYATLEEAREGHKRMLKKWGKKEEEEK